MTTLKTRCTIPVSELVNIGMEYGYMKCDICHNLFVPKYTTFKKEVTLRPNYIFENVAVKKFFICCSSECKSEGVFKIQRGDVKFLRDITWRYIIWR